ncbi:MAG: DUF4405 domain-containing protein [Thermodesulfobacteriota bacterium]
MPRRIVAVSLAVCFLGMATSGLMMFFVEQSSLAIHIRPVHKLIGLVMIVAASAHLRLNFRGLANHLKTRSMAIYGGVLVAALLLLYGFVIIKGSIN